jgi:hypothetical protein
MSNFKEYAVYARDKKIDGEQMFILMRDLFYTSDDGAEFAVPVGFLSDLGSIPQMFWNILPRDAYPSAFILHDYLCQADWISRLDADKILREALISSGATWFTAQCVYWFVRFYVRAIKPVVRILKNS